MRRSIFAAVGHLRRPTPYRSIPRPRFLCTSDPPPPSSLAPSPPPNPFGEVKDVSTGELKGMIEKYLQNDEEMLPKIMEAILQRRISGKHDESDDELLEKIQKIPSKRADDKQFDSDLDEISTDEDVGDLYNARDLVQEKLYKDEFFNMNEEKYNDMIKEATDKGYLKNMSECEQIFEDMLSWDKLLPDDIKQKVEAKFNELGEMCESGEIEPEQALELFKEFEDQVVFEYAESLKAVKPEEDEETSNSDIANKKKDDDPPGEGPILTWETRVVFAPGGDAYHPKNRKVKLSVTVKELGLSKHAFRRLREVVGKRYHSGRDQLTITSERFEHREENRKDCLRTLYALIEDAVKADKLVEEARTSYVKERLKANPAFMERLRAKTAASKPSLPP